MRKYFQYLFLTITAWLFLTGASLVEEEKDCNKLLEEKTCNDPPFITQKYELVIPCLSFWNTSYKGCLDTIGLNQWSFQLSSFKETNNCKFDFTKCATVSTVLTVSDAFSTPSTPKEGFIKLPDVDLSNLGFSDENKMLKESVVLKYQKLEEGKEISETNKETLKNKSTVFSVTLEKQFDQPYSSYGTLKPLSTDKEPSAKDQTEGKKLLAIYMVGSDLEERNNLASKDLRELIKGYERLSNPGIVDIIIAFGGSEKTGWKGVKFVNIEQAKAIFINENETNETGDYLYEAKYANMGDKSTLRFFLGYLQKYFSTENYTRFLVFWDHGASYNGFGNDQVYLKDSLSLEEMEEAFKESKTPQDSFDLVGFDACLMGSIEVAQVFRLYARYLLASEDLEPSEGWNWDKVIEEYVNKETIEAAKAIIDDFAKSDDSTTMNKTLSVVNLSKFDNVINKFNGLASAGAIALKQMETEKIKAEKEGKQYKPDPSKVAFLKAITEARKYGENEKISQTELRAEGSGGKGGSSGRGSITTSIDLNHFAKIIKENANDGTIIENAIRLSDAIVNNSDDNNSYVIKKNNFPHSYGVSFGGFEEGVPSLSGTIADFQKAFRRLRGNDTTPPEKKDLLSKTANNFFQIPSFQEGIMTIRRQGKQQVLEIPFLNGERANFIYVNNSSLRSGILNLDEIEGIAAKITDDLYVARVTTLFGNQDSEFPNEMNVIAEIEAYPATIEDYKDYYFTPMWNQKWYAIQYGEEAKDFQTIPLSFQYRYNGEKGTTYTRYSTTIDYVQKDKLEIPSQNKLTSIANEFKQIQSKAQSNIKSSEYSPFYYDEEGEWYYHDSDFYFITYNWDKIVLSIKDKDEFQQLFYDENQRVAISQEKRKKILSIYFGDDNGTWLYLSKDEKVSEPIPIDEVGLDKWNGPLTEGRFDLTVNNESQVVNYGIRFYEQLDNDKGEPYLQFSKNVQTIGKDDRVVFYAKKLVKDNDEDPDFEPIEIRTFSHDIPSKGNSLENYFKVTDLELLKSGDKYVYAIKAEDINNNMTITEFTPLPAVSE
jgi:hypothetical protein